MTRTTATLMIAALALFVALPASAQDNSAFLENFTGDFDGASKKLADLAEATPDNMYAWPPAVGIRSVSEVYMHVAAANFALSSALGAAMPDGVNPMSLEQEVTEKDKVIEVLKASQDKVREALEMVMNADLTETVQAFGREWTRYQVLMIISGHSHEHLGQSIAYARSVNVAPPWSGGGQ